jgi:hypothetical protein
VHRDAIADALWTDRSAKAARRLVPAAVSRLRRALAKDRTAGRELLVSDGPRYRLAVHVDEHDLLRWPTSWAWRRTRCCWPPGGGSSAGASIQVRPVRRRGMTDAMNEPSSTRNLDLYGHAELPWSRPRDILATDTPTADLTFFVATVRPDGRPHTAGVGAVWVDDALYFVGGPGTRRSRNLAANPACSVAVRLRGIDLTLEGEAHRVTDAETLERLAAVFRSGGWPASVDGDALTAPYSAPSAGPAPWHLYRLTLRSAVGVAGQEPHGATRWTF